MTSPVIKVLAPNFEWCKSVPVLSIQLGGDSTSCQSREGLERTLVNNEQIFCIRVALRSINKTSHCDTAAQKVFHKLDLLGERSH